MRQERATVLVQVLALVPASGQQQASAQEQMLAQVSPWVPVRVLAQEPRQVRVPAQ
jgi:hypothetical protein